MFCFRFGLSDMTHTGTIKQLILEFDVVKHYLLHLIQLMGRAFHHCIVYCITDLTLFVIDVVVYHLEYLLGFLVNILLQPSQQK